MKAYRIHVLMQWLRLLDRFMQTISKADNPAELDAKHCNSYCCWLNLQAIEACRPVSYLVGNDSFVPSCHSDLGLPTSSEFQPAPERSVHNTSSAVMRLWARCRVIASSVFSREQTPRLAGLSSQALCPDLVLSCGFSQPFGWTISCSVIYSAVPLMFMTHKHDMAHSELLPLRDNLEGCIQWFRPQPAILNFLDRRWVWHRSTVLQVWQDILTANLSLSKLSVPAWHTKNAWHTTKAVALPAQTREAHWQRETSSIPIQQLPQQQRQNQGQRLQSRTALM